MLSVRRLVLYFGIATLVAIVAGVGLAWHWDARQVQTSAGEALIGGPFALTDQHGKRVTEQDFAGRYMLIYFGYTFCPDICPTSLTVMGAALDRLPRGAGGAGRAHLHHGRSGARYGRAARRVRAAVSPAAGRH